MIIPDEPTSLGFVGCGTIAEAIVTGLLTQRQFKISKVFVSRRSESKSSFLAKKFPKQVIVCDKNQDIASHCDILFLCVLPEQEKHILKNLDIGQDTCLVSLVSTSDLQTLVNNSRLPADKVYKMICLPAVAELEGTPLLVPETDSNLHELLSTLGGGTCIQCKDESIMEAMMVSSCMMGPLYGLMRSNRDFLIEKGVPAKDANNVIARQYWAMTKDALVRSQAKGDQIDSLDKLISEQTPGGLNEQSLKNLETLGCLDGYNKAMEAVYLRIKGQTDGSLAAVKDGSSSN